MDSKSQVPAPNRSGPEEKRAGQVHPILVLTWAWALLALVAAGSMLTNPLLGLAHGYPNCCISGNVLLAGFGSALVVPALWSLGGYFHSRQKISQGGFLLGICLPCSLTVVALLMAIMFAE